MRSAAILAVGLVFAGCSAAGAETRSDKNDRLAQLVETAKRTCQAEAKDADSHQVPGAFEICIAREANAAPTAGREDICKLAVAWRGFISKGKCYIDPE